MTRPAAVVLGTIAVILAGVAVAVAAGNSGSAGDPRGDAPAAGDVVRARAMYRPSGRARATVVLRTAPRARGRSLIAAYFGTRRAERCVTASGVVLAYYVRERRSFAVDIPAGKRFPASASVDGRSIRLRAAGRRLEGQPFDCVVVANARLGKEVELHDGATLELERP